MIRVFHTNGKFMVWNSDDVLILRTQHRIVGSLVGSLADHTQQNLFHGIPLLLEIEEVFVGIHNNFITLVDNVVFERPTKEDVDNFWNQQYKETEEEFIKERERKKAKEKEWREKNLLFESSNKPKRKKVEQKEKQTTEDDASGINEKENNDKSETTKIEESTLNTNDSSNTNDLNHTTTPSLTTSQTSTTQTTLTLKIDTNEPQQNETNPTTSSLSNTTLTSTPLDLNLTIPSTSLRKMNFSIPNLTFTSQQILRCKIFADLWSRGFYLSCASKFGGDFLAYPGDPLRFHAHFVIIVVEFDQCITMLDIISYGRLAVSVKKSPVLATLDNNDMVRYTTIDWQGVT